MASKASDNILTGNENFVQWNKFLLKDMNNFAEVGKSLSTDMLLKADGSPGQ